MLYELTLSNYILYSKAIPSYKSGSQKTNTESKNTGGMSLSYLTKALKATKR